MYTGVGEINEIASIVMMSKMKMMVNMSTHLCNESDVNNFDQGIKVVLENTSWCKVKIMRISAEIRIIFTLHQLVFSNTTFIP